MKPLRYLMTFFGLVTLAIGLGFAFQLQAVTGLWPWPDGRLSYLFVGSILAAISAAALWIGWSGEFAALAVGTLNVLITATATCVYFSMLAVQGERPNMLPSAWGALLVALASGTAFLWSRRLSLRETRPMPALVRPSFWIFVISLVIVGGLLVLRRQVFPWDLNADSSIIFGWIFLGDASYFAWGLTRPKWHNAAGQLLSFLVYDLVLIIPLLKLFQSVDPGRFFSLTAYVAILIYSGALAAYFLVFNGQTRLRA
jgi:hypothetical protein